MHHKDSDQPLNTFGFFLGLIALFIILILPSPEGLSLSGWHLFGTALLMAIWWVTAPVHISITALIPLIAFPLLGITSIKQTAAPYGHPVAFLLLGSFIIASALKKWNLHKRVALVVATKSGKSPDKLILGLMITVAALSMWISNTASTVIMLTVSQSIIEIIGKEHQLKPEENHIGTALMLGIAYAASIGGISTLVGTPPNAFLAGFLASPPYQIDLAFGYWMLLALPITITLIPLSWVVLTRIFFRDCINPKYQLSEKVQSTLKKELKSMGPITSAERRAAFIFLLVAVGWICRPLLQKINFLHAINDTSISILGAVLLFMIPSGMDKNKYPAQLITWHDAQESVPWGTLLLLGGGLSLANAVSTTDLSIWLGTNLAAIDHISTSSLIFILSGCTSFITELSSNTATTAAFIPIIAVLAKEIGVNPLILTIPVTITASCAFMLPVATVPNALIFSTPYVNTKIMAKTGFIINLCAVFIISTTCIWLVPIIFP